MRKWNRGVLVMLLAVAVATTGCKSDTSESPSESKAQAAEVPKADEAPKAAKAEAKTETPTAAAVPQPRLTGPVAKVNGVPISADAYYTELDKITSRGAKIPPERVARIGQNILKRLIEKELVRQAVEKEGIQVESAEIDASFAEYKKRFQTEEKFQNYLRHGRVTEDSIRTRLSDKRKLEKLIEKRGNLKVTDEEAKEFYAKNERFYMEKAGVRASHILVKVGEKATSQQQGAAMDKIKKAQADIKAGKGFAELAKKYSEGPSAPKGGDLGFFGQGQMVKPFEETAFKLKKGQVSAPVRTRFGLHLIKVTDRREERKKPLAEVKDQIVQTLRNKRFFQERRRLHDDLKKQATIETLLPEPPPAAPKPGHSAHDGHDHPHDQPHPHPH